MKLTNCRVYNFASYKELNFNFSESGLSIVYGPTGSGKSTIPDIASWILFGITAKNGSVDDIRPWQNLQEPTKGILNVELPNGQISISRIRGKQNENDLYWTEEKENHENKYRGKDITETQGALEKRLGVASDLYFAGAYYNEFSPASSFFTAKSKDRRALFEKIASVRTSILLAEKASEARKKTKKDLLEVQASYAESIGALSILKSSYARAQDGSKKWENKRTIELAQLDRAESQQINKIKKLQEEVDQKALLLNDKPVAEESCPTCGHSSRSKQHQIYEKRQFELSLMEEQLTYLYQQLENIRTNKDSCLDSINSLASNPFLEEITFLSDTIETNTANCNRLSNKVKELDYQIQLYNKLQDLSSVLRSSIITQSIEQIEQLTNSILDKHFNAEIRVLFSATNSDNIDVTIQKNGYECSYKQLSKGQRGLLKLCFVVSIMSIVSDKSGVHFDNLFFDEALDGLDTTLKLKAFSLFEDLSKTHNSIFVIDHSPEFQELFSKRYNIELINDNSEIACEE